MELSPRVKRFGAPARLDWEGNRARHRDDFPPLVSVFHQVRPEEEETAPRARWLSQTASTFFLFSSPSPPLLSFFFFFSYVLYSPQHALPWLVKRNQVRCFCEVWSPSTSYCAVNSVSVESKTQWRCGACCIL